MTAVFLIFFVGRDALLSSWAAGRIFQETTGTHGFHLLPKYLWEMIYYIYRVGRAFVWLLPPILLLSWWRRENPGLWSVQKIAGVLFLTGFSLAAARGWWRGGYDQFGKESVLAGCWLLGVAWTVWAVNRGVDIKEGISKIGGEELVLGNLGLVAGGSIWFSCALVLTPFLLGFGTATSVADFAGQGTVFFAAAGVWLLGSTRPTLRILGWGLPALALTGIGLLQASRVATSLFVAKSFFLKKNFKQLIKRKKKKACRNVTMAVGVTVLKAMLRLASSPLSASKPRAKAKRRWMIK
jgi:hypothetical protein